jgi:hypothetical protein
MTHEAGPTRNATLGSIALVLAAMLALPSGMAPVFALSGTKITDPEGDSPLVDFDIKQAFIDSDGNLDIMVYGTAGATVPTTMTDVYAYAVVTDTGIYATDSHEAQHADDEQVANKAWHGHKVIVDENNCLVEIGSFGATSKMAGNNVKIVTEGEHPAKILSTLTLRLELQVEDPDNPPEGVTCIAKIVEVFDAAAL